MKVLLDTHVFLWAATADRRLSPRAQKVLHDKNNTFVLSVASVREILVKASTGKLALPAAATKYIKEQLEQAPVTVLPILLTHVLRIERLPSYHRDPFDRMLIAQAVEEGLPIVTADRAFQAYPVKIIW